jgi:hypothetical protein
MFQRVTVVQSSKHSMAKGEMPIEAPQVLAELRQLLPELTAAELDALWLALTAWTSELSRRMDVDAAVDYVAPARAEVKRAAMMASQHLRRALEICSDTEAP